MDTPGARRTTITACLALAALAGAPLATSVATAPDATASAKTGFVSGGFYAVSVAPHSKDAWAVGFESKRSGTTADYLAHRSGSRWKHVGIHVPAQGQLATVTAASPHAIWAFGVIADETFGRPVIEHSTGGAFTIDKSNIGAGDPLASAATSPSNVWVVGSPPRFETNPLAAYWDGHKWTAVDDSAQKRQSLIAVATTGPTNTWILGIKPNFGYTAARWDGQTLRTISVPRPHNASVTGIATRGPKDVWVVGWQRHHAGLASYTAHWNGKSWTTVKAASPAYESQLTGISIAGSKVYATGEGINRTNTSKQGYILRLVGGTWKTVSTPHRGELSAFTAIAVSSKSGAAVGTYSATLKGGAPTELPFAASLHGSRWKLDHTTL